MTSGVAPNSALTDSDAQGAIGKWSRHSDLN